MKVYGVWYFGSIVRGPFAKYRLAQKALREIKRTCTCAYEKLEIKEYDSAFDMQTKVGKSWTHPSVLALVGEHYVAR